MSFLAKLKPDTYFCPYCDHKKDGYVIARAYGNHLLNKHANKPQPQSLNKEDLKFFSNSTHKINYNNTSRRNQSDTANPANPVTNSYQCPYCEEKDSKTGGYKTTYFFQKHIANKHPNSRQPRSNSKKDIAFFLKEVEIDEFDDEPEIEAQESHSNDMGIEKFSDISKQMANFSSSIILLINEIKELKIENIKLRNEVSSFIQKK